MEKKTFEVLPIGSQLQSGDLYTSSIRHPLGIVVDCDEGRYIRPVGKKKRETLTHDGVEYDANPLGGGTIDYLVVRSNYVVGEVGTTVYHKPIPVEPKAPTASILRAVAVDWENPAKYLEWAKEEIKRLREELGEE